MATRHPKKQEVDIDPKQLAKLKRGLSRTIDDFKESLLEGLTPAKIREAKGPLQESLLPDPVEEHKSVLQEPVEIKHESVEVKAIEQEVPIQAYVVEEKPIEMIQRVKPVRFERINLPNINVIHPDVTPIVEEVVPVARQHNGQVRIFMTGIDNQVNSAVRVFLQKLGLSTYNAHGERPNREFIVEQFQMHSNQFDFAVVVLSPQEVVCQKFQTLEQGLWVTRQETIFELGFLVGKLGKGRVAVFYEEGPTKFKRPTEYFDLLYTPFDTVGLWQKRLINQLYTQGLIREASVAA